MVRSVARAVAESSLTMSWCVLSREVAMQRDMIPSVLLSLTPMSSQPQLILKLKRDSSPFAHRSPQNVPMPPAPCSLQNLPMPLDSEDRVLPMSLDGEDDHETFLAELRAAEEELGLPGLANLPVRGTF